jgi:hypothetical protein
LRVVAFDVAQHAEHRFGAAAAHPHKGERPVSIATALATIKTVVEEI